MNKIYTYFLLTVTLLVIHVHSYGQTARTNDLIAQAISMSETFNSLNGVYPNNESYKTTSKNRAIKTSVLFLQVLSGGATIDVLDSTLYTNIDGKYSELDALYFYYSLLYPQQRYIYPFEKTEFAAKSTIRYKSLSGQAYALYDSNSFVYNLNGNLITTYWRDDSSGIYIIDNYSYNSQNQITLLESLTYLSTGVLYSSESRNIRHGSDYVVVEHYSGYRDSAILDTNGRTIAIYGPNRFYEYTYDTDGYVSSWKYYNSGMLKVDATFTYEPDYKQYAYEADNYQSGIINSSEKRVLVGQSGLLDSVYINLYDTAGVYLGPYETTDVTMDAYGNITAAYIFDAMGVNSRWHRYYYEDVITGLSDIRTPFSDFKVYPNPGTQSDIMISTGENFSSVTISSISGQKILHTSFRPRNEMRLDLSTLSAGSYLIGIRSDDGRESSQVFTKM